MGKTEASANIKIVGRGLKYDDSDVNTISSFFNTKNISFNNKFLVSAKIIEIHDDFVIVSLNDKYDTVIKESELKDVENLKLGDYVDVFIEKLYDKKGQLVVSKSKGKIVRLWENIYNSKNNGFILEINIIEKTQNGLIGDYNSIKFFVPFNQIDNYNETENFIGERMNVIVMKINKTTCNVIASNKAVKEAKKNELERNIIDNVEVGQVIEGLVSNIIPYGVFLTIGGVDFLLHINEISWKHIDSPSEVLKIGDTIRVVVLSVDKETGRLNLSLKQMTPDPWDEIVGNGKIKIGDIYEGKVVNIVDYGVFVEILDCIEGLVHVSEITWSTKNVKVSDFVKLKDIIKVKVINIDLENKRIGLSIKKLSEDPWLSEEFKNTMCEGSKHSCEVIELKESGCIIKLENGVEALVHTSDFSWTKKITKVSEFTKTGDKFDVVVLSIDYKLRKILCGIKQATQNPWKDFAKEFEIGTLHKGVVIKKTQKYSIIKLEHDLEGIIYKENYDDSNNLTIGSTVEVKVLEFNPDVFKLHLSCKDVKVNTNKITRKKVKTNIKIGDFANLDNMDNI